MSKRQKNILMCLSALLLGAVLYIFFRRNTWVSRLFAVIAFAPEVAVQQKWMLMDWIRYYIPDFLWSFSLSCGIQAICLPKRKDILGCSAIALACGVVWEVLQWRNVVSGTGDILDVLMYFGGSILSILINIKERKQT